MAGILALFIGVVSRGHWFFGLPGMGLVPGRCGAAFSSPSLEVESSSGSQSLLAMVL
jgi:hypothetical protein